MSERVSLAELAERTPADRDRYVDFLRAFSIITVVLGHWAIGVIWWQDGLIRTTNAIGITRGMWLATWVLQVMPIFFFVGGFSNLVTYDSFKRKGRSTGEFLRTRAMRLLAPSFVFLGVWLFVQVGMHLLDIGRGTGFGVWGQTWFLRGMLPPGATVPFGPLWFLPAYLVVILLAPFMLRLHRRFGLGVVVFLTLATVIVDVVGFGAHWHLFRYMNIFWVWLLPHQIGFFYGDGRMQRLSAAKLWAMALGGLAVMIALTNPPIFFGHGPDLFGGLRSYPKSLLGTDFEPVANTYPPTLVMVGMIFWSIGVVMLLRKAGQAWLNRSKRAWIVTIWANANIMTMYLWHMTAYLCAILVLWPLGFGQEHQTNGAWWLQRILFWVVPGLFLLGLIQLFGRFERPMQPGDTGSRRRNRRFLAKLALVGLVVLGLGLVVVKPWEPPGRMYAGGVLYFRADAWGNCVNEATLQQEQAWPLAGPVATIRNGRHYMSVPYGGWGITADTGGPGVPVYSAGEPTNPDGTGWMWLAVPKGNCYWLYHING